MLMRDERLATLKTRFDDETHTLTIYRDGKQVARGQLSTPLGRKMIEQFLRPICRRSCAGRPRSSARRATRFSDVADNACTSSTLPRCASSSGPSADPLNPLRFRPNVIIDGLEPWEEFGWLGSNIAIGYGRLEVFKRTQRCAATDVDPDSGKRETAIPAVLQRTWGHADFGVYARVVRVASPPSAIRSSPLAPPAGIADHQP